MIQILLGIVLDLVLILAFTQILFFCYFFVFGIIKIQVCDVKMIIYMNIRNSIDN